MKIAKVIDCRGKGGGGQGKDGRHWPAGFEVVLDNGHQFYVTEQETRVIRIPLVAGELPEAYRQFVDRE